MVGWLLGRFGLYDLEWGTHTTCIAAGAAVVRSTVSTPPTLGGNSQVGCYSCSCCRLSL